MKSAAPAAGRHAARAWARLLLPIVLLVTIAAVGTVGYRVIERWSVLDAIYMTVITIATVGYGETHALSDPGRVFTIGLIVTSIGIAGYALSTLAAFVVEGEFNRLVEGRRMDKRLAGLRGHVILCGGGHTGRSIAEELHKTRTPFVLVEKDATALEHCRQIGDIVYLQGDATEDETLRLAGIERAKGLVSALADDKDNVFVVISARSLNPGLRVVSRLIEEQNAEKLRKAGADEEVSPNAIGGLRMASLLIRPSVVTFLDAMLRSTVQTVRMEEARVAAGGGLAGRTLGEADIARRSGLLVVAVKPRDGDYHFNPGAPTPLREGDVLIVMGTPDQLAALHRLGAEPPV